MKITLRGDRLPIIETKRLLIRDIEVADISDDYLTWINNPEVTRFLEVRFTPQSRESMIAYIESKLDDTVSSKHFGVYDNEGARLVGTVSLPVINPHHQFADISFVIGHPEAQGKGYATEAVHGVAWYLFNEVGLHKLWGGFYAGHHGSEKVFLNNGFSHEGRLTEKLIDYSGKRVDHVLMGCRAKQFAPQPALLGDPFPPLYEEA